MITAKDDFMFDREMQQDLMNLASNAGLNAHEWEAFYETLNTIDEAKYRELVKQLLHRNISELDRIKNGETLSAKEINKAVTQAAKRGE